LCNARNAAPSLKGAVEIPHAPRGRSIPCL
jgi:hypothetical protein